MFDELPTDAPYALPLWVDDADRVYQHLRDEGMPVFRWDRVWPHAQVAPDDQGPAWSRHVLQLLCHQDLSAADGATSTTWASSFSAPTCLGTS